MEENTIRIIIFFILVAIAISLIAWIINGLCDARESDRDKSEEKDECEDGETVEPEAESRTAGIQRVVEPPSRAQLQSSGSELPDPGKPLLSDDELEALLNSLTPESHADAELQADSDEELEVDDTEDTDETETVKKTEGEADSDAIMAYMNQYTSTLVEKAVGGGNVK